MWMENDTFSAPMDMGGRNSNVIDETPLHPTPNSLIQCDSFDLNHQTAGGISMLAGVQGEPISNVDANVHLINPSSVVHPNLLDNCEFQVQTAGGMPITPASLAPKFGFEENLEKSPALPPLEALGPYIFENWQDSSNHLLGDNGYHEIPGNANEFPKSPEIDGIGFQSHLSIANLASNEWALPNVANLTTWSNFSNEPVLSLATSPTVGECSEVNCSDFTHCLNKTRSLSMSLNSNKHVHFSQAILGSRYLTGIQEILAQMARYSHENLEQIDCSSIDIRAGGNAVTSVFPPKRGIAMGHNANSMFEVHTEAPLRRHAAESNKTELLTLVQLVDNRYSQCLDEIHTVVSAFHAATELDPQVHAHFALQTISLLYKDLRDRICNYILAMGATFNNPCTEDNERSVQTSFIQKQWALQQLKRTDHQLWRPQRGLPEKSVCVLRSWMFQNFLHPYPKDAEKHLLAVKSGLTRSQVSNWFINARVRLWKPMIEEMYAEMNKRKACRNERGTESSHRSRISMSSQHFNMR